MDLFLWTFQISRHRSGNNKQSHESMHGIRLSESNLKSTASLGASESADMLLLKSL